MTAIVKTIGGGGAKSNLIDIECDLSNGLPGIVIVGYVSKAVDEARERIRSAFKASKLQLPRKRIIINLAPADIPKEGTDFDLPIAVSILLASGQVSLGTETKPLFLGELSLDGTVREIRGIIGKIMAAKELGYKNFWLPAKNAGQAQLIPDINIIPVDNLKQVYLHLAGTSKIPQINSGKGLLPKYSKQALSEDFGHVVGQKRAKRAMEIAVAGHHNVLLTGPPGTGKSMLAKAMPSIMPQLSQQEIVEITHLHSLAGSTFNEIVHTRPFRAPHHSSSSISIIGGGQRPGPGEISLSHRGVLFLDELPEFNRTVIEALRQPLEDRIINVARAKETITFPADFILVSTANPCPCGHFGSSKPCICLPAQIIKYQKKLSGPIIDRIDLYVEVEDVPIERLLSDSSMEEPSSNINPRVESARKTQYARQKKLNSQLTNQEIKKTSGVSAAGKTLLDQAATRLQLSGRGYMRTVRVARTIADLANSPSVEVAHISEALQYRHQPISL